MAEPAEEFVMPQSADEAMERLGVLLDASARDDEVDQDEVENLAYFLLVAGIVSRGVSVDTAMAAVDQTMQEGATLEISRDAEGNVSVTATRPDGEETEHG